jgi:quercetin dioxygenase-like cupin family protein
MEVLEGRVLFSLDGKDRVVSAGDPPITIKRGAIHGFSASMYCLHFEITEASHLL